MPQSGFIRTLTLVILLLMSVCVLPVSAAEHTVAPSGAEFVTIQDAVDWASSGDTIIVESGTYLESVYLNKKSSSRESTAVAGFRSSIRPGRAMAWISGWTAAPWNTSPSGTGRFSPVSVLRPVTIPSGETRSAALPRESPFSPPSGAPLPPTILPRTGGSGIVLEASVNNSIESNTLTKNTVGITLDEYSLSNTISRNNFINNQNVISKSATSQWSSSDTFTYTYLGQKEQSRMGNYWSDYWGRDRNGDGIGDTTYTIILGGNPKAILESNQNIIDAFPLMDPTEYYTGISVLPPAAVPMTPVPPATNPVLPDVTSPPPSIAPILRNGSALPFGFLVLLLAVMLVIVVVAGLFVLGLRRKEDVAVTAGGGQRR